MSRTETMGKIFFTGACITLICSGVFAQDFDPENDRSEWESYAQPQKSQEIGPPPPGNNKESDPLFKGGFTESNLPADQEGTSTSSIWGFSGPGEEQDSKQNNKK